MKKKLRNIFIALAALTALVLSAGLIYLRANTYPASRTALQASEKADSPQNKGVTIFRAQAQKASLIFYQGALVQPESYAFLGKELAAKGCTVYLIHSPLNLPILDSQKASQIIKEEKLDSQQVFLGGHSLGGVAASANAAQLIQDKQPIKGLILLASYPTQAADLSKTKLPVLSITASQDRIMNWKQFEKAKAFLPATSSYLQIEGGNHSGFGLYGQQKGDGKPTISAQEQQEKLVDHIADFMEKQAQ